MIPHCSIEESTDLLAGRVIQVDRDLAPERDGEVGDGRRDDGRDHQADVTGLAPGPRQDAAQGQGTEERLAVSRVALRCYRRCHARGVAPRRVHERRGQRPPGLRAAAADHARAGTGRSPGRCHADSPRQNSFRPLLNPTRRTTANAPGERMDASTVPTLRHGRPDGQQALFTAAAAGARPRGDGSARAGRTTAGQTRAGWSSDMQSSRPQVLRKLAAHQTPRADRGGPRAVRAGELGAGASVDADDPRRRPRRPDGAGRCRWRPSGRTRG